MYLATVLFNCIAVGENIDTLTYATGIEIIEYYVLCSIRTARILRIKCCDVTSCVTRYVKDFNRDKESEALHSGISKQQGSLLMHLSHHTQDQG